MMATGMLALVALAATVNVPEPVMEKSLPAAAVPPTE